MYVNAGKTRHEAQDTLDAVAEWKASRDRVIRQRDDLRGSAPPRVVVLTRSPSAVAALMPVVLQMRQAQRHHDVVAVDGPGTTTGSTAAAWRAAGIGVKGLPWLEARCADPGSGVAIMLLAEADDDGVPATATAAFAAEYGIRIAYLGHEFSDHDYGSADHPHDTQTHRCAWRIYAVDESERRRIGRQCSVGDDAIRVVGDVQLDRVRALPAQPESTRGQRVVWTMRPGRKGGRSGLSTFAPDIGDIAAVDPSVHHIVHLAGLTPHDSTARRLREMAATIPTLEVVEDPWDGSLLVGADALISDGGGSVRQMMALDKPVMSFSGPGQGNADDVPEHVLATVVGSSWEDIERFLADVKDGVDHLAANRRLSNARSGAAGVGARAVVVDDMFYSLPAPVGGEEHGDVPLLNVALIVRDEEANIGGCLRSLQSIRDVVSQVVVYDTGSTDATISIARQWGAKVVEGYWDDDFARARNDAVRACRSRWVYMPDADELVTGEPRALRQLLRDRLTADHPRQDVLCVTVHDMRDGNTVLQSYPAPRLTRPDAAKYVGRVHERAVLSTGELPRQSRVDDSVLSVVTHGYQDPEVLAAKLARNARIATLRVTECSDAQDWDGLVEALVDRARAVRATSPEAALADYERAMHLPSDTTYRWWGMEQYCDALLDVGRNEAAAQILTCLDSEGSTPAYRQWIRMRLLHADGRANEAADIAERLPQVQNSAGALHSPVPLLRTKLRVYVAAGRIDDALPVLVELMASYGHIAKHGPLFTKLSARLSPHEAASCLLKFGDSHIPQLRAELQSCGDRGAKIAAALPAR